MHGITMANINSMILVKAKSISYIRTGYNFMSNYGPRACMLSRDHHDGSQVYLFAQTFEHYSYLSTTVTVLLTRALIYHHTHHDQP